MKKSEDAAGNQIQIVRDRQMLKPVIASDSDVSSEERGNLNLCIRMRSNKYVQIASVRSGGPNLAMTRDSDMRKDGSSVCVMMEGRSDRHPDAADALTETSVYRSRGPSILTHTPNESVIARNPDILCRDDEAISMHRSRIYIRAKNGHDKSSPYGKYYLCGQDADPDRQVWRDRSHGSVVDSATTDLIRTSADNKQGDCFGLAEATKPRNDRFRLGDYFCLRPRNDKRLRRTVRYPRLTAPVGIDQRSGQGTRPHPKLLYLSLLVIYFFITSITLATPQAFVVNNLAETLSRIDLSNGSVQNHITVLGTTPNQISYSGGYLYVLNSISADLQKIDPQTHSVIADIPLPAGSNPYNMALDDQYAYVVCLVSGSVERIDLSTNQLNGEITIGGYPEGALIFGNRLYVAQTGFNPNDFSYGQGQMAVIGLDSFTLETEVNVGKDPQSIIATPDGRLHVVCTGNYVDISGAIYIYNPLSGAVEDSILIGGQPVNGVIASDGICFLAAGGWVDHGYIYSYNAESGEVLHGPSNPIQAGLGISALAMDSLGFIYSCDFGSDTVTKLNSSGQIITTYDVGDGPQSIVILDDRTNGIEDQADRIRPNSPSILGSYPNPFNSEALIEYRLPAGINRASLTIFDIGGRLIRRLNLGTGGDIGEVVWNGRSDNGLACPSGLYLARLETDFSVLNTRNVAAIKLLLVK
jgi:YVTN family beta-propeller protein